MVERRRFFRRGEVIFREGEQNDAVYFIESGCVAILKAEPNGNSVVLAKLVAPEMLGEMAVLSDLPRNATAQALEDSWLLVVPHNDFTNWIREDPDAAFRVIQTLAWRLREADQVMAKQQKAPEELTAEDLRELNRKLSRDLEEIQKHQMRLEDEAIRDSLTGLYNRRYLDETLDRELARAKREGFAISLAMIDLDHFKQVNDTYGHKAGDEVLKSVGELLQSKAREGDIPCRYGGEEFALVLPRMPIEIARERAESWREAFSRKKILFDQVEIRSTMSIGLAAFPEHATTAGSLLGRADKALYKAKSSGRNLLMVADNTP